MTPTNAPVESTEPIECEAAPAPRLFFVGRQSGGMLRLHQHLRAAGLADEVRCFLSWRGVLLQLDAEEYPRSTQIEPGDYVVAWSDDHRFVSISRGGELRGGIPFLPAEERSFAVLAAQVLAHWPWLRATPGDASA